MEYAYDSDISAAEVLPKLRFDKRSINGFDGEEVEMQTGGGERPGGKPTATSLREDALLAPWDRISSSIRLRQPSG